MEKALEVFRACHTMRWHTDPDLSHTQDSIGGHQGRVAALVATFFPSDLEAIKAAVLHDLGEAFVADVPSPVKKCSPELRELLHKLEAQAIAELGVVFPKLTPLQAKRVYFCDQLDALMWGYTKAPWLCYRDHWQEFEIFVNQLAEELGVYYELPHYHY